MKMLCVQNLCTGRFINFRQLFLRCAGVEFVTHPLLFFDSIIPVKFGPVILLVVEKQCMKKIFTLAYKRMLPSLLFIFAQAKSFALDTASAGSNNTSNSIFTHPILWIAIIVTTILVIIGPLHQDREYPVIMKKKDNSNKKKHSME